MVLSISGLGSQLAMNVIDATRGRQLTTMRSEPLHARAEADFRSRISAITTPADLVKDYKVYSFIMKAFDLEDQIFGKGMVRKILESDPSDDSALVNRLTDSKFTELHETMGFFTNDGPQTPDFSDASWVQGIVDKYYNRVFINENDNQNSTVGTVLNFRETASGLTSWFHVLKDSSLTEFFQTALSLPSELSGLDIDIQKRILSEKYDLSKLADPVERERLVTRYIAISDVLNPPSTNINSIALSVLQNFNVGGQFVPITIDMPTISYSAASLYR